MDAAKKYEYIKTLGEGSYGHVWLCRDRERDCLVAIKKFKDANKDSQAYHLAMREIKLLRASSHEHVVSVIEAFRSQSSGNVYLVMEFADNCLNHDLKKNRNGMQPEDVERIAWQLASSLQYLHAKKVMHRDLKPANILLTAGGDVKLCDFGFARDLPSQSGDLSSYVTTRWYRAPEVVVGADYGCAVDIWAYGCLFGELLNGQPLFPGNSNIDQLALIVNCFGHLPNRLLAKALTNPHLVGVQLRTGNPRNWAVALQQRFASYGEDAINLLLACLNPDPLKRATADEIMRMPYFANHRRRMAAQQVTRATKSLSSKPSSPSAQTAVQQQAAPMEVQQEEQPTAPASAASSSVPTPHPVAAEPQPAAAASASQPMDASAQQAQPDAAAAADGADESPESPESQHVPAQSFRASASNVQIGAGRTVVYGSVPQVREPPHLGKPGATLMANNGKRMSDVNTSYNTSGYASSSKTSHSLSGANAALPVRFARMTVTNAAVTPPHGDVSNATNISAASTPLAVSTPPGAGSSAQGAGLSSSFRRRSTANGSRMSRMSTTAEGQDRLLDEGEEDEEAGGGGRSGADVAIEQHFELPGRTRPHLPPSRLSNSGTASTIPVLQGAVDGHHGHGPSNLGRMASMAVRGTADSADDAQQGQWGSTAGGPAPAPPGSAGGAPGIGKVGPSGNLLASTAAAAASLTNRPTSHLTLTVSTAEAQAGNSSGSGNSSAAPSPSSTTPTAAQAASIGGDGKPQSTRRATIADGPSSILRSMLRTLSSRRASGTNTDHQQQLPPPLALATGTTNNSSAASSAGVSPFVPTRPSSNNFIAGGPLPRSVRESADGAFPDSARGVQPQAKSEDGTHLQRFGGSVAIGGGGSSQVSPAQGTLPYLPQRVAVQGGGAGQAGYTHGYGSAAVSPARRSRLVDAVPGHNAATASALRMSDNGTGAATAVLQGGAAGQQHKGKGL